MTGGPGSKPLFSPAAVREILGRHRLRPSKSLGQHFLVDGNTLRKIVALAGIVAGDLVLEIGPGVGALTQSLLEAGARVVAIEKDARLCQALRESFASSDRMVLIHADALEVDFAEAVRTIGGPGKEDDAGVKIVANLPYYITSPLVMKVLESRLPLERAVLMVQQEVADRMGAAPGSKDYGALSVAVQYRAEIVHGGRVPPTVFYPPPAVGSAIVVLRPRPPRFDVGNEELFFRVVRAAFGQRRKTLKNALRALDIPFERVEEATEQAGIKPERRGETLSVEEFARLSRSLSDA